MRFRLRTLLIGIIERINVEAIFLVLVVVPVVLGFYSWSPWRPPLGWGLFFVAAIPQMDICSKLIDYYCEKKSLLAYFIVNEGLTCLAVAFTAAAARMLVK